MTKTREINSSSSAYKLLVSTPASRIWFTAEPFHVQMCETSKLCLNTQKPTRPPKNIVLSKKETEQRGAGGGKGAEKKKPGLFSFSGNIILFGQRILSRQSLRRTRNKGREVRKPCEEEEAFVCSRIKTHRSSAAGSSTLRYKSSRLLPLLLSLILPSSFFMLLSFLHFSLQFLFSLPPSSSLWSALYPPVLSILPHPPSLPHIPTPQRLVINASFNCHAHFYAH